MAHSHDSHANEEHAHQEGEIHVHVVPIKLLLGVFGILMVLTVLTLAARAIDLGPFNIWLALGIAFVKAVVVCLYFMHLRWDRPFHSIVLISSMLFVVLFVGFSLVDTKEYAHTMKKPILYGSNP